MEIKLYKNDKVWYYRVTKNDEKLSKERFLNKFNFSMQAFEELNPTFEKPISGKVLLMPASAKYVHIVAPLENYSTIAKLFNCTVEHLKTLNGAERLFVGQKIFI